MLVVLEQAVDDFVTGIVRIGDKVERLLDINNGEQGEHFIEQGAFVAIGPHQAFVNADGERYGKHALGGMDQQGDRLQGYLPFTVKIVKKSRVIIKTP
jgi:hypothetical protein